MEYLIKVSAILVIFYLCYRLLLHRETFFESNRTFLLLGLITAFILPLITISKHITVEPVITNSTYAHESIVFQQPSIITNKHVSIASVLSYIYIIGAVFFMGRFIIRFGSLIALLLNSTRQRVASYIYVITKNTIAPFSFFNWIVFNPNQFNDTELEQIITHEKVHAKQLHSIDILLTELTGIFLWFNPLVWLYKKDLRQNLEFIADKNAQANTNCKKSYQHLLVKTSVPNYQMALTNNFYNSSIKKRIVMLHKNRSHKRNQLKFLLIVPILVVFLMSFNTQTVYVQAKTNTNDTSSISPKPETATINSAETTKTDNASTTTKPIVASNTLKTNTVLAKDIVELAIESTFSDTELDNVAKKLKAHGVTLKIKGVKRNSDNEITAIKIEAETTSSSANFSISNDSAIATIKITYNNKDNSISIGNTNNGTFSHKNGVVTLGSSGKNSHAFSFSSNNDDQYEILEDDDKITIKNGSKIQELKKTHGKSKNAYVFSGSKRETYEIIQADTLEVNNGAYKIKGNVVIESKDGNGEVIELKSNGSHNGNVMFISKDKDGNVIKETIKSKGALTFTSDDGKVYKSRTLGTGNSAIWVNKDGKKGKTFTKIGKNGGTMLYMSNNDKDPLVVIDGKITKNKKLEDIDADNIKSITYLNEGPAKEKYGKKGKDGVVEITTKKTKN